MGHSYQLICPPPTLNVNISRSTDPIAEISFRPYSPDQGLSNEPKIIENESVDPEIFVPKCVKKICTLTLNVNISRSTDPIGEISFRPDSPDQGLSNKPKIIENESVDPEIFAPKCVKSSYSNFKRKYLRIY
jgi:hypothetical protein